MLSEQELVRRAKAGGQDAFEQLVLDNQNKVYSLALRMVNDRGEAEDLAQEAFLRAWQGLPSFQGESAFSTWLYRLTANVCIDFLRRRKRRQEVETAFSLEDAAWEEPTDPVQDPQRQLERAELDRAVAKGLEALPDHHRQVLTLREVGGLSYQEISEKLGLDLGTVKSRIARARLALRRILLESGNFSPPQPSNLVKDNERR